MDDTQINRLMELRYEIDSTDNQIHDLLMHRAYLSSQIGALKKESGGQIQIIHPARETEILRRLWTRHQGGFDKRVLIKIWREIISASVNMQKPMTIAVYMPKTECMNMAIAKEYFGIYTEAVACKSESLVLKELTQGEANIGVFSLDAGDTCWWYAMAQEYKRTLSVFASLPFIENSNFSPMRPVYAVGRIAPEPTGEDKTLLFAQTDGTLSLSTLDLLLKAAGIETLTVCDTFIPDLSRKAYLFEVKGFITKEDSRLENVLKKESGRIEMLRIIGSFPVALK